MQKFLSIMVLVIYIIIVTGYSTFGRESNTYVRLNTDAENQLQDCEALISSVGGKDGYYIKDTTINLNANLDSINFLLCQ